MSAGCTKGTVGVVGLGIMGGAIAANLASAGWRVIGFDVDRARTQDTASVCAVLEAMAGVTRGGAF